MTEPGPYELADLLGEFGRRWAIVPGVQYADGPQIQATARRADAPDIRIARRTVAELRDALRSLELSQAPRST